MIQLIQRIGDTKTFSVPLRWNGRPFVPGADWHLVFTVKADEDDEDADAVIQLQSDSGILHVGSYAQVAITHALTVDEAPRTLVWDIQAESLDSDEVRTVASGSHVLLRDIGRARVTAGSSIPDGTLTFDGSELTFGGNYYLTFGV